MTVLFFLMFTLIIYLISYFVYIFYVYFKYFILFYFYQTIFKQIQTKNLGANFGQIRINKYNTLYVSQF
nr:MAG TPA: hypothetical protein [Inoviridae sp.]